MNMDLYITILESSVEHLDKLQKLLSVKHGVFTCRGMTQETMEVEMQNIGMILKEIAETAGKIEKGASELLNEENNGNTKMG